MTLRLVVVLLLLMGLGPLAVPMAGQTPEAATRTRLGTLFTSAPDTPEGKGLLATAIAEAQAALTEAARAAQAEADLAVIQAAAAGVLHVLDPVAGRSGPGHGYGLRRALAELREQTDALASDAQADVRRVAPRALSAIRAAQTAADALKGTAQQLQEARLPEAAGLAGQLREQAATVLVGAQATAERVFLAVGGDPERHNQAVLADMHAIGDQSDQVERLERGRLFATERDRQTPSCDAGAAQNGGSRQRLTCEPPNGPSGNSRQTCLKVGDRFEEDSPASASEGDQLRQSRWLDGELVPAEEEQRRLGPWSVPETYTLWQSLSPFFDGNRRYSVAFRKDLIAGHGCRPDL